MSFDEQYIQWYIGRFDPKSLPTAYEIYCRTSVMPLIIINSCVLLVKVPFRYQYQHNYEPLQHRLTLECSKKSYYCTTHNIVAFSGNLYVINLYEKYNHVFVYTDFIIAVPDLPAAASLGECIWIAESWNHTGGPGPVGGISPLHLASVSGSNRYLNKIHMCIYWYVHISALCVNINAYVYT